MDESLRKIWWLASFPKSGNTLVRLFVNCYVTRFPIDINAHYQYACIDQQTNLYQQVCSKPLSECLPAEIFYLRPAMLMNYLQVIAPRDACFKTHNANVQIDGIPMIPQRLTKQAVYLVRDPRDVAVSYARHSDLSIDDVIEIMGKNEHVGHRGNGMQDIILSWSSHVDSWRKAKFPVEFVRFEDLISDRESTFRRILPALGFRNVDEEAFQFALRETEFDKLQKHESEGGFREAKHGVFFGQGRAGYWREVLTENQVKLIESNHGDSMTSCGYSPGLVTT